MRSNNNNNNNNKKNLSGGGHRHRPRSNNNHKFRSGGGGGDSQSLDRQKKHAMAQKEKFLNLARDAQSNGERIEAEYYFQHVEHYSRSLAEILDREPQPQQSEHRDDDTRDHHSDQREDAQENVGNYVAPQSDHDESDNAQPLPREQSERASRSRNKRRPAASAGSAQGEIPLPSSILPEPSPITNDQGNA